MGPVDMASTQSIEILLKSFWLESGIHEKGVLHEANQEKEFDRAFPRERYTPGLTNKGRNEKSGIKSHSDNVRSEACSPIHKLISTVLLESWQAIQREIER